MPKVGNKRFPYTEKGIQDAEKYAEMTGLSVDTEYREGGSVFNRQGGRVPGMRQDLPQAYVGGALKNIIKGVPKSLKRLLSGKSGLKVLLSKASVQLLIEKNLMHWCMLKKHLGINQKLSLKERHSI